MSPPKRLSCLVTTIWSKIKPLLHDLQLSLSLRATDAFNCFVNDFLKVFESSKSDGAKLPTLGLNHNLIHSNPVILQCFLRENLLLIAFLRCAPVNRHSKKKWSTIITNRQVEIDKKMLYVLVVE